MMDFTPKTWADYPDTSTPITAAELNRIEQGVAAACAGVNDAPTIDEMNKAITQCVINGINALHPEYEKSYRAITATPATTLMPSGGAPYWTIDKPESGFESGYDGLLITVDSLLISPAQYTVTDSKTQIVIEFHTSFTNGQTLTCTLYHKPQNGSSIAAGEAVTMSDGVISQALAGIPGQIIDLMDYELITTDTYTSSVPKPGEYIELKNFQEWFPVNSNQVIQVIFKYNNEETSAVVRMKINGSHSGCTGSDDDYFVVSELSNYQGVATTVRPLIKVDGTADLSKLTQFYMIITEV